MKITSPILTVTQPIGTFYIATFKAYEIFKMFQSRPRSKGEDGVQRDLDSGRLNEIATFTQSTDSVFPTSIILSVDKDEFVTIEDNNITIEADEYVGDVIDGQHRLNGIIKSDPNSQYMLPVVIMFKLDMEDKGYIFSIINGKQMKVNTSLLYDLFGLSTKRSPQKTGHELARSLNMMPESPFYDRLKMLGRKAKGQEVATLSQGTFVQHIMKLYSSNPEEDKRILELGGELSFDSRLPFRKAFIQGEESIMLKVLLNYFSAVKTEFPKEWDNATEYVLWKTTGYGGLVKAFPYLFRIGVQEKTLKQSFFEDKFSVFKSYLVEQEKELTGVYYSGGGETVQWNLCYDILDSLEIDYPGKEKRQQQKR